MLARLLAESAGLSKKASALKEFNDAARKLQIATALIQILTQTDERGSLPLRQVKEATAHPRTVQRHPRPLSSKPASSPAEGEPSRAVR